MPPSPCAPQPRGPNPGGKACRKLVLQAWPWLPGALCAWVPGTLVSVGPAEGPAGSLGCPRLTLTDVDSGPGAAAQERPELGLTASAHHRLQAQHRQAGNPTGSGAGRWGGRSGLSLCLRKQQALPGALPPPSGSVSFGNGSAMISSLLCFSSPAGERPQSVSSGNYFAHPPR